MPRVIVWGAYPMLLWQQSCILISHNPMPESVILLVEDREDDIVLIQTALKRASVNCPIHVVRDGEEAIAYLKGEGAFADRSKYPLPDLMLLDLKMPRKDGLEVLQWIRQQSGDFRTLRVIVLTASNQIRDVNTAYALGANSFLVKPLDFQNFIELGRTLTDYWLNPNITPTSGPAH